MTKKNKPQQEIAELKDKLARTLADYQNQDKRHAAQRIQMVKYANETLLNKFVTSLDDLDRAQKHLNDAGLGFVIKQINDLLKEEGVTPIDPVGADFDPLTMDCSEVVEGEKNKVIKTTLKGYLYHDKTLRPAKVEVGSGAPDRNPEPVEGSLK